jgi:hypothetical protein
MAHLTHLYLLQPDWSAVYRRSLYVMSAHHNSDNVYHVAVEKIFHDICTDKTGLTHPVSEECVNVHLCLYFRHLPYLYLKSVPL